MESYIREHKKSGSSEPTEAGEKEKLFIDFIPISPSSKMTHILASIKHLLFVSFEVAMEHQYAHAITGISIYT